MSRDVIRLLADAFQAMQQQGHRPSTLEMHPVDWVYLRAAAAQEAGFGPLDPTGDPALIEGGLVASLFGVQVYVNPLATPGLVTLNAETGAHNHLDLRE